MYWSGDAGLHVSVSVRLAYTCYCRHSVHYRYQCGNRGLARSNQKHTIQHVPMQANQFSSVTVILITEIPFSSITVHQWQHDAGAWKGCAPADEVRQINRVNSKIKCRATLKLYCRCMSPQYQCDNTVLSSYSHYDHMDTSAIQLSSHSCRLPSHLELPQSMYKLCV